MAEFGLMETQEAMRQEVRTFARREFASGAKERAKMDRVPHDVIEKLSKMDLLGLTAPSEYGGQSVDWVTVGIVLEEIAKVDWTAAESVYHNIIAFRFLEHAGESLRREWIPAMVKGEKTLCFGVTEPDCGSDVAALRASATREGSNYILRGEKTSITRGMHADAAVLFLRTGPLGGMRGISSFLVPLDLPGISRSLYEDMGWKPMGRASITLDEASIPSEYLIGEEGKGVYFTLESFDFARVAVTIVALSMAEASLHETIEYAKQRNAFGQPIAKFEGVSFKIAEAATLIDAAKLLAYRTLWLKDHGVRHTKESAMCKWWGTELAARVVHDCILILGHLGYSEECPLEQRLRDIIGFEIADGPAQIQKIVIARELMGKEFLPY